MKDGKRAIYPTRNVESTVFDDARQTSIFCFYPKSIPSKLKNQCKNMRVDFFFKPNTPLLHHSYIIHVGITQIATDIPITNSLDSHPPITPTLHYSNTPVVYVSLSSSCSINASTLVFVCSSDSRRRSFKSPWIVRLGTPDCFSSLWGMP